MSRSFREPTRRLADEVVPQGSRRFQGRWGVSEPYTSDTFLCPECEGVCSDGIYCDELGYRLCKGCHVGCPSEQVCVGGGE